MKSKGLFITFEGVEGAGKTTQVNLLYDFIKSKNKECVKVREPGSTIAGEKLRMLIIDPTIDVCLKAELLMIQASRAQLTHEIILPALNSNDIVISDRFFDSSIAYQSISKKDKITADSIKFLNKFASFDRIPDITFILDIDPKIGLNRAMSDSQNNDKFELKPLEFHNKVRKIFRSLKKMMPDRKIKIISGTKSVMEIHNIIIKTLNKEFEIFQ